MKKCPGILMQDRDTVNVLLSPLRVYLISELPEGGLIERVLIREEGLFTKSSDKDICDSFGVGHGC